MTDQADNNTRLAFVDIFVKSDGSIRGGVLVTDIDTRPFEFRVTSPVKPTQLQQILYGNSLREYVYAELICVPLLKQLKEKVTLAICVNENLLVARPQLQIPIALVKKVAGGPVSIQTHRNFPGELAHADLLVNELVKHHDVDEIFKRVELAVDEVHKQKVDQK